MKVKQSIGIFDTCGFRPRALLRQTASLKLTLFGMLALMFTALMSYRFEYLSPLWVAGVLTLLAVNLICAIADRPQFRRQSALLVFHFALLAILMISVLALMTRMQGRIELVEGQHFDAASVETLEQGPWHRPSLHLASFEQGRIAVKYWPDMVRGQTSSEIRSTTSDTSSVVVIGDTQPLSIAGYRFLTTSNKGYAVLLRWQAGSGQVLRGAVNMPSYPLYLWKQQNQWITPTGQQLELELELPAITPESAWTLTSRDKDIALLVHAAEETVARLQPGDYVSLLDGRLYYQGVRLWMGYRIESNGLLPWLFAAAIIGVLSIACHFWRKLGALPTAPSNPGSGAPNGETAGVG